MPSRHRSRERALQVLYLWDMRRGSAEESLDAFYGSFRLLESNPSDLTIRQEVLARTEELANAFNRMSIDIESVRCNTDKLLRASAAEINVRIEDLVELNEEIVVAKVQG